MRQLKAAIYCQNPSKLDTCGWKNFVKSKIHTAFTSFIRCSMTGIVCTASAKINTRPNPEKIDRIY